MLLMTSASDVLASDDVSSGALLQTCFFRRIDKKENFIYIYIYINMKKIQSYKHQNKKIKKQKKKNGKWVCF